MEQIGTLIHLMISEPGNCAIMTQRAKPGCLIRGVYRGPSSFI